MKTDLATSIGVAIVGALFGYFVCNMCIGPLESFSFPALENSSSVSSSVAEPDVEVFNNKALNPTVEVYVGNCQEYANGECFDDIVNQEQNEDQ